MKFLLPIFLLGVLLHSCNKIPEKKNVPAITDNVTIFEIYLRDSDALDELSVFIKDTLGLPVEWNNFDLFGNHIVYDEAFFLGNTTFEIVALYEGDSTLNQPAKFNRIIFGTDDITALSNSIKNEFQHPEPTNFNIVSGGEEVTMGIQTNLDSLSESSNFYVSFWEYLNTGLSFPDRTVNAASVEELYQKLGSRLATNPLGIIELKEIHLSLSADITDQWHQLLGPSENNTWNLAKGPVISYDMSPVNKGID